MTSPGGGNAAAVWVAVLPDLSGFGAQLARGVAGQGGNAGERLGSEMGEATESSFSKAAKGLAIAGAAIGASVGAAVVQAMDVEAANDKLSAQLGLTGASAERYGRIAGDLYSGAYGDSLETVNEALRQVTLNIGGTATASDSDLQRITASVLDVATAFDQDLGGTTAAVGQLMRTGLATDATSALDIITVGFQNGVDKAGDFLDTINEYSTLFRNLGLDGAQATGILSQGLQAGARDADLVADALKEFSIRAVDGSTASADGFRQLGLDGAEMARKIAAGGPEATGALDLVLDRLRAMPDPVARSQTAVALFGTQAEDLGAALFALDPSAATDALGQVGGAAADMGAVLNDNAATNLESFKRQAVTAFVEIVGGQIIPIVSGFASFLATNFGPALAAVGGFVADVVVPAFQGFVGWLRDSQSWLLPLAAGLGTVALVLSATTIATTLWGVATSAASAIMGIVRGAVLSFQVAMWLLNAAMAANPIGIIVALIAGLVAAFVVAYNTSDTFRGIVQAAWQGIQDAARVAWESVIKPVIDFLVGAFQMAGQVAMWLWNNAIKPAWDGIVTGIGAAWAFLQPIFSAIGVAVDFMGKLIFAIVVGTIIVAWETLSAVIGAVWNGAIKPVWDAISVAINWLWNNAIKPVFDFIVAGWSALGAGVQATHQNVIRPAWDAVAAAANWLWNNVLRPVFDFIVAGWRNLGAGLDLIYRTIIVPVWEGVQTAARFLWENVLQPVFGFITGAWDGLARGFDVVYRNVIEPVFRFFADAVRSFQTTFTNIVDGIKRVWESIQEAFRAPVRFVVNTVWNNGIGGLWDKAAALFPLGPFPRVVLPFAKGGPIEHPTLALMGEAGPEYVLSAPAVQGLGGMAAVDRLHKEAVRRPLSLSALNSGNVVEGADHDGPGISSAGFGGVKPHVARAGHYLKNRFGISSVGGVGQRANASDHPRGLALDFMTYNDQAKGDRLVNYLLPNAGHFAVKYIIWKQRINSGNGWRGMEDRGSVTANHFDHPHVSFLDGPGGGGGFSGEGGGFLNPLPDIIRGFFDVLVNPLINSMPGGPPMILDLPKAVASGVRDKVLNWLLEKAGGGPAYDSGGLARGRGYLRKDTLSPERVLSPRQTVAFENLVDYLRSAPTAATAPLPGATPLANRPGGGDDLAGKFDELIALLRAMPRGDHFTVEAARSPEETARKVQLALRITR